MKFKENAFQNVTIILICILFFITPVNALEYNITDFTEFNDINEYDNDYMLVAGVNSYYGTDAVAIFNAVAGTSEVKIQGFTDIQAVGYDGINIYWSDANKLYMYDGTFLLNGSYHTEGVGNDYLQIATVTNIITDIYVDANGDIYFSESKLITSSPFPQAYIYKVVPPTYAISQIYHRTSGDEQNEIQISSNLTHMIIAEGSSAQPVAKPSYIKVLKDDYTEFESITTETCNRITSLFALTNGDIYYATTNPDNLRRLEFNNSYAMTLISTLPADPRGMVINSEGIIYITFSDGYIRNYLTVDSVGGFSSYLSSTGLAPSTLTYDISIIDSIYDSYFNDSNIKITYNIETELLSNDNEDLFNNYMRFRIDLLQGATPVNTEYIESSEFSMSLGYLNIYTLDIEHRYSKDGTITYTPSPNWDSGVYNVKLYEVVNDTLSQLDSDTYTVLETQSNVSITTTQYTPTGDPSEITNKLISSNLFYAGIIIMAFTTIGAVYGGVGAAIGGFVGTVISYGVDLIPEWVVLAIVILLIVVASIFMSKSGD